MLILFSFSVFSATRLRLNKFRPARLYVVGLAWLLVLFLSACGGQSLKPAQSFPPENFTVTVTATSGSLCHTVQFGLALH